MILPVDLPAMKFAFLMLSLCASCCLQAADNGSAIRIREVEFKPPSAQHVQITTQTENVKDTQTLTFKAKMEGIKYSFDYIIRSSRSRIYISTNEYLTQSDKVDAENRGSGHIIDTYYREHIQGSHVWLAQTNFFDKETKNLMFSTDYYVNHAIYAHAGEGGFLIFIFQLFEWDNQRAREVSAQLLMECIRNTTINGKQLVTNPKFFKNKHAMLDIKRSKR
jgi:hypothetical protein